MCKATKPIKLSRAARDMNLNSSPLEEDVLFVPTRPPRRREILEKSAKIFESEEKAI